MALPRRIYSFFLYKNRSPPPSLLQKPRVFSVAHVWLTCGSRVAHVWLTRGSRVAHAFSRICVGAPVCVVCMSVCVCQSKREYL